MTYPLGCHLAADGIPVAVTCRVLGFTPQAFHAWRKDPVSRRDWDGAHLINALGIHHDDPAFGSDSGSQFRSRKFVRCAPPPRHGRGLEARRQGCRAMS